MRKCHTQSYERDAFASDQFRYNTLQHLYLSGNNLTVLGRRGFRYLDDLIELYVPNLLSFISFSSLAIIV